MLMSVGTIDDGALDCLACFSYNALNWNTANVALYFDLIVSHSEIIIKHWLCPIKGL